MEGKCANPLCSQVLEGFGKGRLFVFEAPLGHEHVFGATGNVAEYFWLCQDCASTMTLISDVGQEPVVICLDTEQLLGAGTA